MSTDKTPYCKPTHAELAVRIRKYLRRSPYATLTDLSRLLGCHKEKVLVICKEHNIKRARPPEMMRTKKKLREWCDANPDW